MKIDIDDLLNRVDRHNAKILDACRLRNEESMARLVAVEKKLARQVTQLRKLHVVYIAMLADDKDKFGAKPEKTIGFSTWNCLPSVRVREASDGQTVSVTVRLTDGALLCPDGVHTMSEIAETYCSDNRMSEFFRRMPGVIDDFMSEFVDYVKAFNA